MTRWIPRTVMGALYTESKTGAEGEKGHNFIGVGKAAPQELLHRKGVETRNAAAISR
ncbi:hypothetical protein GCM10009679_32760 [Saccharothrix algeriensis]|uniref:Uncharacterized protein n=1 Tax=Catellatospora bangladeshensis TaxID=310355 RepID=A0A8J3JDW9_9ACTN|nr:hypothetical protein Cba03nite_21980 [Catellatospora bangladeshensis]